MRTPRLRLLAPIAALLAAACSDGSPLLVEGAQIHEAPGALRFAYRCDADVRAERVRCGDPATLTGGARAVIMGSPYVVLTSSNVNYNAGTQLFTFDVTVKNQIWQPIGTTDGSTLDASGVRAFFHQEPVATSGSGIITVVPDGYGTFTASAQPYYQYDAVLDSGEVSSTRQWTFQMPSTVGSFSFTVYVSAPVQYENGLLTVTLSPTSVSAGGSPSTATAVVRSAVKVLTTGTVSWSSPNTLVATTSALDDRRAAVYGHSFGFVNIGASHTEGSTTRNGSAWLGVF